MKIAQFTDNNSMGGAEALMIRLARSLKERGHEVVLIHFDSDTLARKLAEIDIPSYVIPHRSLYKSIFTLPLFAIYFRYFIWRHGFDVVHAHLFGPVSLVGLSMLLPSRIRGCGTLHDTYTIQERSSRSLLLRISGWGRMKLVAISHAMEEYLVADLKLPIKVNTIYNGVPISENKFSNEVLAFRRELELEEKHFIYCCVARLVPLKNHLLLLSSFSRLCDCENARLVIVGSGPMLSALEEQTRSLGLEQRVIFTGERSDVDRILGSVNCFVLTSDTEGLSCSILEAMAAKLPVVATKVGGNHELVVHGETGYLSQGSPEEIASFMRALYVERDGSAVKMGQLGYLRAQELFSLEHMVDSYLELYE